MIRFLETLTEVLGWMRIVSGPLLIGCAIGIVVYSSGQNMAGMVTGGLFALTGLIVGIIWANRIWKRHGTIAFLSRVDAVPELDEPGDRNLSNTSDEK